MITYETEDGRTEKEEFGLVVLSVGLEASRSAGKLASDLGIELDGYGFCKTSLFSPLETSRPGVFGCGSLFEPNKE